MGLVMRTFVFFNHLHRREDLQRDSVIVLHLLPVGVVLACTYLLLVYVQVAFLFKRCMYVVDEQMLVPVRLYG